MCSTNWHLKIGGDEAVLRGGEGGLEFLIHPSNEYFACRSISRT